MNDTNKYSDEHISAFIDGELDNDERALLLIDEQDDDELAQRINEARMLKEKVKLTYSDLAKEDITKKTFSCPVFINRTVSLVASLIILVTGAAILLPSISNNHDTALARQLIENTNPISPGDISSAIGANNHIVIDISRYQPQSFDNTIKNLEALLQKHSADKLFRVEIVANKAGLKALDAETSVHAERISQMVNRYSNLKVVACAKSLAKLAEEGDPVQLMKSIMMTSSAAEQVAKRTGEGWFYLKL